CVQGPSPRRVPIDPKSPIPHFTTVHRLLFTDHLPMASYLKMPKLSDTMSEGTLAKCLKKEGDPIAVDEDVAEIETDKATMTMQSFEEGILHKSYVKEG